MGVGTAVFWPVFFTLLKGGAKTRTHVTFGLNQPRHACLFGWQTGMTAQSDEHCSLTPNDQFWLKSSYKNFLNAPLAFSQNNGDDTLMLKAAPTASTFMWFVSSKLLSCTLRGTVYMSSQQVQCRGVILFYTRHWAAWFSPSSLSSVTLSVPFSPHLNGIQSALQSGCRIPKCTDVPQPTVLAGSLKGQ